MSTRQPPFAIPGPTAGRVRQPAHPGSAVDNMSMRQAIQEAAFARITHYGFRKTTMADIAEDLGMSAANLYRYVENKQELCAMCASHCMGGRVDALRPVARDPRRAAAERLRAFVHTNLEYTYTLVSETSHVYELVETISTERPDLVREKAREICALIAEILSYGNETGEFEVEDVLTSAEAVHASLVLFEVPLFLRLFPPQEFERMANAVVDLLVRGLRKA